MLTPQCSRLLKGAAPGRKQVNFYTGELNCIRNSKSFARRCETDHRAEVLAGHFDWSVHHTGMGGVTADQKFYDPERVSKNNKLYQWNENIARVQRTLYACFQVKDYTGSIRFKDPERAVPVLAWDIEIFLESDVISIKCYTILLWKLLLSLSCKRRHFCEVNNHCFVFNLFYHQYLFISIPTFAWRANWVPVGLFKQNFPIRRKCTVPTT